MKKENVDVSGMHCVSCSIGISKLLRKQKGINDVEVTLSESKLSVTYDETKVDHQTIIDTIGRLGYKAKIQK